MRWVAPIVSNKGLFTIVQLAESADWAGGERYVELLARHLDRSRFRMEVILPAEGPLSGTLAALAVPVHLIDLGRLIRPWAIRELANLLRRLSPHLLQSHGARSNFYARLAGRLARVPVIVSTVHNSLYDYPVSSARKALYLALDRLAAPLSHRILCVAEALARDLVERSHIPSEKITVIRNGVDIVRFNPSKADAGRIRKEFGLQTAPTVGMVGRMTPQKNYPDFLRALALVRTVIPTVRALLVGDGPDRPAIEALATQLDLVQACRFTGVRDDIPDLLAAMDVVVLASVSEGLPFVVLEALSLGRPVVATTVNGVPELVEDGCTGLLVPPRDPRALAEGMVAILRNPELGRALGMAGRNVIETRFSLGLMIQRLEGFYTACLLPEGA